MIRKTPAPGFDPGGGNRFSDPVMLRRGWPRRGSPAPWRIKTPNSRRYWSSGSRINDFFWLGAGLAVTGAPDASAAEAAGGGGTAALGGGSSGPLRPQADRPSAAATSTASANLTLKRSKAKRRSPPASATRHHSRSNRSGEILAITPCQRVYLPQELGLLLE